MTGMAMSRRYLLAAGGAGVLAGASGVACTGRGTSNEDTIRRWYAAWQQPAWDPVGSMLTDDFTFTSAAGDDHISKSTFKTRCWESNINFIGGIELEQVFGNGNQALVKYLCRTKNGKSFRNVELLTFRDKQISSIECYFGEQNSFPSAVSAGQKG
ncbi:MAG TPA: nuclear transport factor 2 family protein [Polyangiaceae bacterium]